MIPPQNPLKIFVWFFHLSEPPFSRYGFLETQGPSMRKNNTNCRRLSMGNPGCLMTGSENFMVYKIGIYWLFNRDPKISWFIIHNPYITIGRISSPKNYPKQPVFFFHCSGSMRIYLSLSCDFTVLDGTASAVANVQTDSVALEIAGGLGDVWADHQPKSVGVYRAPL